MPENKNENPLSEIERLEKELADKKAALENLDKSGEASQEQPEQKEDEQKYQIEKESSLSATTQPTVQAKTQAQTKPAKKTINDDFKSLDKEHQVKVLAAVAFEEGIMRAVDLARHLDDAYVLDKLHDQLVGDLYERLVEEKKLKKV